MVWGGGEVVPRVVFYCNSAQTDAGGEFLNSQCTCVIRRPREIMALARIITRSLFVCNHIATPDGSYLYPKLPDDKK